MRMCVALSLRCSAGSRVVTEPISTSPPPEGNLVSACIDDVGADQASSPSPIAKALNAKPAPQVLSIALRHAT